MSKDMLRERSMFGMGKKLKIVLASFICLAMISTQYNAFAFKQTPAKKTFVKTTTDPRIVKLTADLEYASKAEAEEIQKYAIAKQARLDADAKLNSLNSKISAAQKAMENANAQEEQAKAEYAQSQEKYDQSMKDSNEAKEARDKAMIDLYIAGSDPDNVPSIMDVEVQDRQDVLRKAILIMKFTQGKIDQITQSLKIADEADAEKALHVDAQNRAKDAATEAQKQKDALVPLKADLVTAQVDAKAKEAVEQKAIDSIKGQKSSYTKQINQIQAESNALAAEIKKKQSQSPTTPTVPPSPGKMIHPVPGAINSSFGYRVHPIYGDSRLHAGIDFNAGVGTPIKAAKAGKVITASVLSGYGNVIVIDHGGGISTLYAHQSSFAVGVGAQVTQGQLIGYSGQSGNVTGPHLHFEVRVNGTPTDPMPYF